MFIDSRQIPEGKTIETDLCIIGAGVSGIVMARELRSLPLDVCLVESGGLKPDKTTQSLYWGGNVGIPYYPLDTARARFFGGTSHFWHIKLPERGMGVRLRPLDPIDFEKRDWIPYSGWPFGKAHLDPFYHRAQKVCQIGPYNYEPDFWTSPDRPALEFRGEKAKTAMFQFADREVFFQTYRKELEEGGNIRTLLNANVTNIETTENAGKVTRLAVKCLKGSQFWIKARVFVLATGGIEVPRLLLLSNDTVKNGLGNQNDLVGRFFMEHPHLWSGCFIPSSLETSNAMRLYEIHRQDDLPILTKFAITQKTLREEKLANYCVSIHPNFRLSYQHYMMRDSEAIKSYRVLKSGLKRLSLPKGAVKHAVNMFYDPVCIGKAVFRKLRAEFERNFYRTKHIALFSMNHMSEQTPNPNSRVSLMEERDALGQCRAKLDWRLNALDIKTITRAQEIIDREMRHAGLGHLRIETKKDELPEGIHGGWHHMGTTRMNVDPKKGVVDPDCKIHGISNLYVAGTSVFPTGGYSNPVLTMIALVLRLSDHLREVLNVGSQKKYE